MAAMPTPKNKAWAELVQLVPIVSLALPFIVSGSVDLSRARSGFLLAAALSVVVSIVVLLARQLLNPILVGTGLWLCLGALAFGLPIRGVASWLVDTQAFGLFAAAWAVGLVATFAFRYGYVACSNANARWIRQASLGLLALTSVCVAWAWVFRHEIRLGGGLPFIVLNVARRLACRRAPTSV